MFNYIIVAVILIVAAVFWIVTGDGIKEAQREKRRDLTEAIKQANEQPLDKAIRTLRSVGITYIGRRFAEFSPTYFKLPKDFWDLNSGVGLNCLAKVFITLVTHKEKNTSDFGDIQKDLALLFVEQARKNPGTVIAIACEIARQAKKKGILEEFFKNLPYV